MPEILNPVTYYRASRWLHRQWVPFLPEALQAFCEFAFRCDLPYTAKIGPGLELTHRGFGVLIHPRAEIGRNVVIGPYVTIDAGSGKRGVPRIGNNVSISAGARISGNVIIGDGAIIGANAVVTESIPPNSSVEGISAATTSENIRTASRSERPASRPIIRRQVANVRPRIAESEPGRILMFIQSLEMGGSETQCVEVAARLAAEGYEVTIGCLQPRGPLKARVAELGLPLIAFPVRQLLRPAAIREMLRLVLFLRKFKFQVVQANDLYANLFAVPAAWLAKVPVVISCQRDLSHWWWYTPARRKLVRKIQAKSSYLLVNSDAIRTDLIERDGFNAENIRVIHNGVDSSRFAPGPRISRERVPGVSESARLIVMVANMRNPVKGHADMITAAKTVCRAHPNVRFLLIGDGTLRGPLEARVRAMGLEDSVLFLGNRNDVADVLSLCEIGVLASRAEGLPNAVLEYMSSGLATVATNVGGVPEIIQDGVDGLLVPSRDPAALAGAILRLLNDESLRQHLASAARESVLARFDFATVVESLKALYHGPCASASQDAIEFPAHAETQQLPVEHEQGLPAAAIFRPGSAAVK